MHMMLANNVSRAKANLPLLRIARLPRLPIFYRLCVEEALFYKTQDNWFVSSEGPNASHACIVLGISGKPEQMCNLDLVSLDGVILVRRFSGGGTVVVDKDTLFTSLIMNQDSLPAVAPYPKDIMEWSSKIFQPALKKIMRPNINLDLDLRENDYVFENMKFGGNAQAISKARWLHHTSFLWDFNPAVMQYLQIPVKRPKYRGNRVHSSFLTTLKDHITDRAHFFPSIIEVLDSKFNVEDADFDEVKKILNSLGGIESWIEQCRTKVVSSDGKQSNDFIHDSAIINLFNQ